VNFDINIYGIQIFELQAIQIHVLLNYQFHQHQTQKLALQQLQLEKFTQKDIYKNHTLIELSNDPEYNLPPQQTSETTDSV
jgi:hypothetical protein